MFKNCYHFSTEALEDKLLCYDEEDFRVVWNAIIICAAMEGITIYCFCIMSNHIHILLSGTEEQIRRFFAKFKQKTGRHFQARYNMHTARELSYKLFAVKDRRTFCQEVAYILRNPYKAGISSPFSYKWSTADAYFKPSDSSIQGRYVSDFPSKKLRTILKTRFPLPASLQIRSGRITSHSFVDYTFVEKMFDNSSLRFFNLIKTWNIEDIVNSGHGQDIPDAYTDTEVLRGIRAICQDTFNGLSLDKMDQKSLATVVRRIRSRFGCGRSQLLRLLPVDDFLLDRIL